MWIKRTEYENLIADTEKYHNRVKELERVICGVGEGKTMYISRLNDGAAWGLFIPSGTFAVYNDKFSKLNTENDDLKKKVLELEAIRDYYKIKLGELLSEVDNEKG